MENIPEKIRLIQRTINKYYGSIYDNNPNKITLKTALLEHSECKKIITELKRNLNIAEAYGGVQQLIDAVNTKQLSIFENEK